MSDHKQSLAAESHAAGFHAADPETSAALGRAVLSPLLPTLGEVSGAENGKGSAASQLLVNRDAITAAPAVETTGGDDQASLPGDPGLNCPRSHRCQKVKMYSTEDGEAYCDRCSKYLSPYLH